MLCVRNQHSATSRSPRSHFKSSHGFRVFAPRICTGPGWMCAMLRRITSSSGFNISQLNSCFHTGFRSLHTILVCDLSRTHPLPPCSPTSPPSSTPSAPSPCGVTKLQQNTSQRASAEILEIATTDIPTVLPELDVGVAGPKPVLLREVRGRVYGKLQLAVLPLLPRYRYVGNGLEGSRPQLRAPARRTKIFW